MAYILQLGFFQNKFIYMHYACITTSCSVFEGDARLRQQWRFQGAGHAIHNHYSCAYSKYLICRLMTVLIISLMNHLTIR